MSTSVPEDMTQNCPARSSEEASFLEQVLTANAKWSAAINNAALDGQERTSNEWARRYLMLVSDIERALHSATPEDRFCALSNALWNLVDAQGHYPEAAAEQNQRYFERIEREKAELESSSHTHDCAEHDTWPCSAVNSARTNREDGAPMKARAEAATRRLFMDRENHHHDEGCADFYSEYGAPEGGVCKVCGEQVTDRPDGSAER